MASEPSGVGGMMLCEQVRFTLDHCSQERSPGGNRWLRKTHPVGMRLRPSARGTIVRGWEALLEWGPKVSERHPGWVHGACSLHYCVKPPGASGAPRALWQLEASRALIPLGRDSEQSCKGPRSPAIRFCRQLISQGLARCGRGMGQKPQRTGQAQLEEWVWVPGPLDSW